MFKIFTPSLGSSKYSCMVRFEFIESKLALDLDRSLKFYPLDVLIGIQELKQGIK